MPIATNSGTALIVSPFLGSYTPMPASIVTKPLASTLALTYAQSPVTPFPAPLSPQVKGPVREG